MNCARQILPGGGSLAPDLVHVSLASIRKHHITTDFEIGCILFLKTYRNYDVETVRLSVSLKRIL